MLQVALLLSLILQLEGRQTARQKQKALRGIRSSSFLADMGLNIEDAQYGQFDSSLAQVYLPASNTNYKASTRS